jgi:hypothetical protein
MTLMYFTAFFFFVSLEVDSRHTTVWGLAKVAIFTIPNAFGIDAENQTLINHKCVCGARNPAFWVGAVM